VIFCYAERLPSGKGYHLNFLPAPDGISDDNIDIAATAMNLGVERCIRAIPEQYQWTYKRFKTRPINEKKFY
jgi:KDO2-lipid IV(A) lauroyltransferase